jgi:hypothetical protein
MWKVRVILRLFCLYNRYKAILRGFNPFLIGLKKGEKEVKTLYSKL